MTDNHNYETTHSEPASSSNIVQFGKVSSNFSGTAALQIKDTLEFDGLPAEFLVSDEGVFQCRQLGDEDEELTLICSPIYVRGSCRRADGNHWGRVVDIRDPDGKVHRHIVDEAELSSGPAALLRPLRALGLVIEPVEKADQSVVKLLRSWRPSTRFMRADALGWADSNFNAFALGNAEVIGDAQIVFQNQVGSASEAMRACGSLDEWRSKVAEPCNGNPLMILTVSHAFTGPLLQPLAMDGGGFHLRGASSSGKSTLLGVAASVWGAPSFVQSWRGTDNGIEGIAAACSSTLLVLDELYQVSPQVAGDVVYMLGNGRGKARAQTNGKAQPISRWHVPLLSSGEISLEEHMATGGKSIHAGQETRLLDIAADSRHVGAFDCLHGITEGRLFAEQMQMAVQNSYGTAGPAFVRKFMKNTNHIDAMNRFVNRFCEEACMAADLPPDGQVQRALRRFAVAALAGEMATKFGITGWAPGIARNAAMEIFSIWFEERDVATRSEISTHVERTRAYIANNLSGFLEIGEASTCGHAGWKDNAWYYILPKTWTTIHASENAVEVARLHQAAGLLKTQKGSGLQYRMGRKVEGRPKTYAVNASLLEE